MMFWHQKAPFLVVLLPRHQEVLRRAAAPVCVDLFICVWIKACIPDKGDVRTTLTATEAAECARFGRRAVPADTRSVSGIFEVLTDESL